MMAAEKNYAHNFHSGLSSKHWRYKVSASKREIWNAVFALFHCLPLVSLSLFRDILNPKLELILTNALCPSAAIVGFTASRNSISWIHIITYTLVFYSLPLVLLYWFEDWSIPRLTMHLASYLGTIFPYGVYMRPPITAIIAVLFFSVAYILNRISSTVVPISIVLLIAIDHIFFRKVTREPSPLVSVPFAEWLMPEKSFDVIILGSNLSALATGALLSQCGKRVLVLESGDAVDGNDSGALRLPVKPDIDPGSSVFQSSKCYFGMVGVVTFLLSWLVEESETLACERLGESEDGFCFEEINMGGVDVCCRAPNSAGESLGITDSDLLSSFPHEAEGIKGYLNESQSRAYASTLSLFLLKVLLPASRATAPAGDRAPDASIYSMCLSWVRNTCSWPKRFTDDVMSSIRVKLHKALSQVASETAEVAVKRHVRDPLVQSVLTGGGSICPSGGVVPSEASAWLPAALLSYYRGGAFFPVKGLHGIIGSLAATISTNGGSVVTGAPVQNIIVQSRGSAYFTSKQGLGSESDAGSEEELSSQRHTGTTRYSAVGVLLRGKSHASAHTLLLRAPVVVSALGARCTYLGLLRDLRDVELTAKKAKTKGHRRAARYGSEAVMKRAGLDPRMLQRCHPRNGHIGALVTLQGTSQDYEVPRSHNVHSLPSSLRFNLQCLSNVSRLQQIYYTFPMGAVADALITLICPRVTQSLLAHTHTCKTIFSGSGERGIAYDSILLGQQGLNDGDAASASRAEIVGEAPEPLFENEESSEEEEEEDLEGGYGVLNFPHGSGNMEEVKDEGRPSCQQLDFERLFDTAKSDDKTGPLAVDKVGSSDAGLLSRPHKFNSPAKKEHPPDSTQRLPLIDGDRADEPFEGDLLSGNMMIVDNERVNSGIEDRQSNEQSPKGDGVVDSSGNAMQILMLGEVPWEWLQLWSASEDADTLIGDAGVQGRDEWGELDYRTRAGGHVGGQEGKGGRFRAARSSSLRDTLQPRIRADWKEKLPRTARTFLPEEDLYPEDLSESDASEGAGAEDEDEGEDSEVDELRVQDPSPPLLFSPLTPELQSLPHPTALTPSAAAALSLNRSLPESPRELIGFPVSEGDSHGKVLVYVSSSVSEEMSKEKRNKGEGEVEKKDDAKKQESEKQQVEDYSLSPESDLDYSRRSSLEGLSSGSRASEPERFDYFQSHDESSCHSGQSELNSYLAEAFQSAEPSLNSVLHSCDAGSPALRLTPPLSPITPPLGSATPRLSQRDREAVEKQRNTTRESERERDEEAPSGSDILFNISEPGSELSGRGGGLAPCSMAAEEELERDSPASTQHTQQGKEEEGGAVRGTEGPREPPKSSRYEGFERGFRLACLNRLHKLYPRTLGRVLRIEIAAPASVAYPSAPRPVATPCFLECSPAHFNQELMDKYLHPVTAFQGLVLCGEDGLFDSVLGSLLVAYVTSYHVLGLWGFIKFFLWTEPVSIPEICGSKKKKSFLNFFLSSLMWLPQKISDSMKCTVDIEKPLW